MNYCHFTPIDELTRHAQNLARQHQKVCASAKITLRGQIKDDIRVLERITQEYRGFARKKWHIPLAGEWLIDNFYLINEQAQFVLRNLPSGYYRRLPALAEGPCRGKRRIYAVIQGILDYSGARPDLKTLLKYLEAYQEVQPLTIGELWAVPLFLRAAIINKLRRIFEEINQELLSRRQTDIWDQRVTPLLNNVSNKIHTIINTIERHLDLSNPSVLVHLARQFQEFLDSSPLMHWLEARTAAENLSLSQLVEIDHHKQAGYRATVGQLISALREITHTIWEEYFEDLSRAEQILRQDPAEVYPEMDFASRDYMRHTLEKLSKLWNIPEWEIAGKVISLAKAARPNPQTHFAERHVGYYLTGPGRAELSKALGDFRLWIHFREVLLAYPNIVYFSGLLFFTGLFTGAVWELGESVGVFSGWVLVILAIIMLVPAMEWGIRKLNWLLSFVFPPYHLPKLEFRKGVPREAAAMVVVPCLLSSKATAEELVHHLEICYLANSDPNIYFALLTDFNDAPNEVMPGDEEILKAAIQGIDDLNARYPNPNGTQFYLLHRRRKWNPVEEVWMGWERKRGKLTEFNALLHGSKKTTYAVIHGDTSIFKEIRYVITLDADTVLPRDAAVRLIGAIAHPLNAPVLNNKKTKIIRGYGLLQPRISITHASINTSLFARLFGGKAGIDVYSGAVSDPYQDLFQYGIFTGKGIYDVKVFHQLLRFRIPENSILSHDLLEGSILHAGLVSDIELFDDYPSNYISSLSRMHRWVRGDWQLLPWLTSKTRNFKGHKTPVGIPLVAKWQMIDNLRRSLLGPVLFGLTWLMIVLSAMGRFKFGAFVWIVGGISLVTFAVDLIRSLRQGYKITENFARILFNFLVLPFHSYAMLDAIIRTLYRLTISKKHLLEWVTAAEEGRRAPSSLTGVWRRMLKGQIIVVGLSAATIYLFPAALPLAIGAGGFWLFAPIIVYCMGRPIKPREVTVSAQNEVYLRKTACRIWQFFTMVVSAEDHWLPPDNLQIDPANGLAHRTSPTNIGLYLASVVNARDFGYITTSEMLDRIDNTLSTLEKMARWHGHFYNWYDTLTLNPLAPVYVSSVDSGNLTAYLIAVRQSLDDWLSRPLLDAQTVQGLIDMINSVDLPEKNYWALDMLQARLKAPGALDLLSWYRALNLFALKMNSENAQNPSRPSKNEDPFRMAVRAQLAEMERLYPWLNMLSDFAPAHGYRRVEVLNEREAGGGAAASSLEAAAPGPEPGPATPRIMKLLTARIPKMVNFEDTIRALDELIAVWEAQDSGKDSLTAELVSQLVQSRNNLAGLVSRGRKLMRRIHSLALAPKFLYLYDPKRRLFSIGYNVSTSQIDSSYYDLLASEMRQTSFVAIALGQIPTQHWFALGRTMSSTGKAPALMSWSGTMFEYLMPLLLLPNYENTLWDVTYRMVIKRQMEYAGRLGIPWGISESGYNSYDFNLNYQYKAFGVPGLGLKEGLDEDQVISPYSTLLAAQLVPDQAALNLQQLERYGVFGKYGFYEAIDFTRTHLSGQQKYAVIKSYMAHHQGMGFLALGNLLLGKRMQKRFMSDPRMEAAEPLLRERVPARGMISRHKTKGQVSSYRGSHHESTDLRSFYGIDTPLPEARFLSNGRYLVMLSNNGSGFSSWGNIALTRWRPDPVRNSSGIFFYIRNLNNNSLWSPTYQPLRVNSSDAAMNFSLEKVTYKRSDGRVSTNMEVCVSPELDAEIRRITLANHGEESCTLEITSFLEPVLDTNASYESHPVFKRLFIETEALVQDEALLAHRRSGKPDDTNPWLIHAVVVEGQTVGPLEYETDRSRFFGRGRSASIPQVILTHQPLSGASGYVLDPVLSLRRRVELAAGKQAKLSFITGVAPTREGALDILQKLRFPFQIMRTFDLAWSRVRGELHDFDLTPQQINLFQWLASQIFYFNPYRAERARACLKNSKGQSGLWAYGISGDLPIVLARLGDVEELGLAETLAQAHWYWRLKGLPVDLVIINDFDGSYEQTLQEMLRRLIDNFNGQEHSPNSGRIFLLAGNIMPEADQILFETVAHLSFHGGRGNLISQLQPNLSAGNLPSAFPVQTPASAATSQTVSAPPEKLVFFNSWGGFSPTGDEYIIYLKGRELPPAPWSNVIANPRFGFLITESGGGYTWSENSREYKLSSWSNDPVLDPAGEICYLRDEKSGMLWTPTPLPIRDSEPYTICHGQGYTCFQHTSQGIEQSYLLFVPREDPVKIAQLTLRNTTEELRQLSVTYYIEWVLGVNRDKTAPYLVTEYEPQSGVLMARNVYQEHFPGRYGFLQISADSPILEKSWTGDRAEFIGRNGSLARPAALERCSLSRQTGAKFHACGAMQVKLALPPGAETKVTIMIGAAKSVGEAQNYAAKYTGSGTVQEAFAEIKEGWKAVLEQVQVKTPDTSFDFLCNRWLLYQTLSCRLWSRSAFYQSGGAFGFRDQLQDSLALLHANPLIARKQIILHAAHQYLEGDVQHWWHNETGYGIRTRFSDDLLWLPYVACSYVEHTGDNSIWEETAPFLEGQPLREDETERYAPTRVSDQSGTIYEHCIRAIDRALQFGEHGLPLIGSGDWNDGLNNVGVAGRGESVWLGWFLYKVLKLFIPVCVRFEDLAHGNLYQETAKNLMEALDRNGWDGRWYRRAYTDDGKILGSITNSECQIDCIAQAWAVISGAAPYEKALEAMLYFNEKLVSDEDSIACLLTPPFAHTSPSPGYIQAYPPGVRENGGQYTHGIIWAIIAWAKLGEGNQAYRLFHLLNPVNHALTQKEGMRYKVEPYVMAADVYSVMPYTGRGGWTWYTGAAGWMYQACLGWILGIQKHGSTLRILPCIPEDWPEYSVIYKYGAATYEIRVYNPRHQERGVASLTLDGEAQDPEKPEIPLIDDGRKHEVIVTLKG
ncbi:MAG: glycosyl transferase family 36 [Firmicutes bacterium]|nr:glycosyl transferase family 36 [Bacillota bacterium]